VGFHSRVQPVTHFAFIFQSETFDCSIARSRPGRYPARVHDDLTIQVAAFRRGRFAMEFDNVGNTSWPVGKCHPCIDSTGQGIGFAKPIHALAELKANVSALGVAWVQNARGLLLRRTVLDKQGTIADYYLVAPTEWNFHPDGPYAQGWNDKPATTPAASKASSSSRTQ
jgi:hypothetical protein